MIYSYDIKDSLLMCLSALAGVMPYIVLHAKSLGISAGLAGTANAIMLITSIFLKFYLGALADKFRAVKGILIQVGTFTSENVVFLPITYASVTDDAQRYRRQYCHSRTARRAESWG